MKKTSSPYWDPYLSGVGLGLVLLASFVFAGRGIGVSGALDDLVETALAGFTIPSTFNDWLVVEILGLIVGAAFSGWNAWVTDTPVDSPPSASVASPEMKKSTKHQSERETVPWEC